jgi:hypothetical protein
MIVSIVLVVDGFRGPDLDWGEDAAVGPFESAAAAESLVASLALDRRHQLLELVDPETFEIRERRELGIPMTLEQTSPHMRFVGLIEAFQEGDLDRVAANYAAGGNLLNT